MTDLARKRVFVVEDEGMIAMLLHGFAPLGGSFAHLSATSVPWRWLVIRSVIYTRRREDESNPDLY